MINRKSIFWLLVIAVGLILAFTYVYRVKYCATSDRTNAVESQEEILARSLEATKE